MEKIVLAYSGGLDTSVMIPWLKENYGYEVIAVSVDLGQDENWEELKKKAIKSGASECIVYDGKKEFLEEYCFKFLKSSALYENKYLCGTISRFLIARVMVDVAKSHKATAICHGATGKGNDQIRFELTMKALMPSVQIVAPWRDSKWNIKSRTEAIDYAKERNIDISATKKSIYSRDHNIWYVSSEGGVLEDTSEATPDDIYSFSQSPLTAVAENEILSIEFKQGIPISLNGKKHDSVELVNILNSLGKKHGIGVIDIIENRIVGMKSRGVYESPGAKILFEAHQFLESATLEKRLMRYKQKLSLDYANLVYDGAWLSPLRVALDRFIDESQKTVTGSVSLNLYKGNVMFAGIQSKYNLFDEKLATFEDDEGSYNQSDAEGYIAINSIPYKVWAKKVGF